MKSNKPAIAVDIGGTKYITAMVDGDGKVLCRRFDYTLASEGPRRVISRLVKSIHAVIRKSGISAAQLGGMGIAAAGLVDTGMGTVTESPNLPHWRNIRLRDILAAEFNMPVFLLNDASAAALGEYRFGSGRDLRNIIFMTVSTGIGGGIVVDGELYSGVDGCAGEIGHMIIQVNGSKCSCGRHGCLESLASGTAIANMAKERLRGWEESLLTEMVGGAIDEITAETVAKAAKKGDGLCCDIVNAAARFLGVGLGNLVNIFNPQMIIIGGGLVSGMGEMILRPARKSMREHAFKLPSKTVRVVRAGLGADAGMLGAAIYAQLQCEGMK